MRLLNLSDIHFREPDCLHPDTDPDVPFRTRLSQDVISLCHAGGPVDVILVGGDIAFKGHPDEYKTAEQWLLRLADDCGCPPDRIFVVPGNHDVDRGVCGRSQSVVNAQSVIAQASRESRERTLRTQLRDRETGRALFLPLEAYNKFAAKFGCNVYADQPFWKYDLELGSDVTLRMFGLTSIIISGLGERDNVPGRLYLSPLQTVFNPEPNVLNLVISHHPPSWFMDEDEVDDAINNRVGIQMFGHKHRQRCARTPEYIRFSAGAVNPDRYEPDWRPGYNLIDLEVNGSGAHRGVQVRAHVRHLQNAPERFTALKTNQDEDIWTHQLSLPSYAPLGAPRAVIVVTPSATTHTATTIVDAANVPFSAQPDAPIAGVTMSNPSTKNLVFRFWSLSVSQKREIAFKLNLISENDLNVPEPERYARALKLAAQRGQLEELAKEVEQVERQG
jgi:calcineurin-like phosphoesterase family protein